MIQVITLAILCSLVRAVHEEVPESDKKPCGEVTQPCAAVRSGLWFSHQATSRKQAIGSDVWYLGFRVNAHGELQPLAPTDSEVEIPSECAVATTHWPFIAHLSGQMEMNAIRCTVFLMRRSPTSESQPHSKVGYRSISFSSTTESDSNESPEHNTLEVELRLLCGSERLSGISSPQAKFADRGGKNVVTLATPSFCQEKPREVSSGNTLAQAKGSAVLTSGRESTPLSNMCVLRSHGDSSGTILQPGVDLSKTFSATELSFEHTSHSYKFHPCTEASLSATDPTSTQAFLVENELNSNAIRLNRLVDRYRWTMDAQGKPMIQAIFASADMRAMFTVQVHCVRFVESVPESHGPTGVTVSKVDRQLHVDGVLSVQLGLTVELCRTL